MKIIKPTRRQLIVGGSTALALACYLDDRHSLAFYFSLVDRLRTRQFCPRLPQGQVVSALIDKAIELGLQRQHLYKPGAVFVTWLKLFEAGAR